MRPTSTLVDLDTRSDGAPAADDRATPRDARFAAVVAVLALVAGLLYAPPWRIGSDIPVGFAARLRAGDLQVEDQGEWVDVRRGDLVPSGATVRSDAGAELAVDNGSVSLGAASRAVLATTVEVEAGSLLVSVDRRERAVQVGALTATGRGTWRIDAAGATRVGVYSGTVDIGGPSGSGLAVDSLRQAPLTGGRLPERSLPLAYGAEDPWDQRFLAGVIATDRQVARLERALTAEFGTEGRPASFYATFVPEDGAIRDALPQFVSPGPDGTLGPPADVLLHVVVTGLIVDRVGLEVDEAVGKVVALRRDGATWGLLLAIYGLGGDGLRAAVDEALRGPALEVARAAVEAAAAGGADAGTAPGGAGESGDGQEPQDQGGPIPEAPGGPPAGPDDPCPAEECEPVEDAVGDLTDVLDDAPAPGTGEPPDEDPGPLPSPSLTGPSSAPSVSGPSVGGPSVEGPAIGVPAVPSPDLGTPPLG